MGSRFTEPARARGRGDRAQGVPVRRVRGRAVDALGQARAAKSTPGYTLRRLRSGDAGTIGYARVSTRDQSLDAQIDALAKAGCCRIYAEQVSALAPRPGWSALVESLRPGDVVTVVRLDRIGRRISEVLRACDQLRTEGCHVHALAQGMDTRTAAGRHLLPIWAALAETERVLIVERTQAGLAAAKRRGAAIGRPRVVDAAKTSLIVTLRSQGYSLRAIGSAVGVSEASVRAALERVSARDDPRQLRL